MRIYTIDQLDTQQCKTVATHLENMGLAAGFEGLYWLPIPAAHLSATQQEHAEKCGPYALALELTDDSLHLELLVRARNAMRCECITAAPPALRLHMINYVETMLEELGIVA